MKASWYIQNVWWILEWKRLLATRIWVKRFSLLKKLREHCGYSRNSEIPAVILNYAEKIKKILLQYLEEHFCLQSTAVSILYPSRTLNTVAMLWRSIHSSLPGNSLITFYAAAACVLRNKRVEFHCEPSAQWCHLASWHLVNDCVWKMSNPHKPHVVIHSCFIWCPRMFFYLVINVTHHLSIHIFVNHLSALVRFIPSWLMLEAIIVSDQPKVPGFCLWETGMQKTPIKKKKKNSSNDPNDQRTSHTGWGHTPTWPT